MSHANEPSHITEAKRAAARTSFWMLCVIFVLIVGGNVALIVLAYAQGRPVHVYMFVGVFLPLAALVWITPRIWRRGHPKPGC